VHLSEFHALCGASTARSWQCFTFTSQYLYVQDTKRCRYITNKLCAWRHNMHPPPASWQYLRIYSPGGTCSGMLAVLRHQQPRLTFDLESVIRSSQRVTWATFVPILVFLGLWLSVLELGPMYATDKTDVRQIKASINASTLWGGRRHNN